LFDGRLNGPLGSNFMKSPFRAAHRALITASALTLFAAAPAAAQQIDDIVVLGDSYADTGNAFALGYNNPDALAVYSTGRFSGGTNYIDTLAQLLGVPVENYAIGGALGGVNNTLICFDPPYGNSLCGKGFAYEVDQAIAAGNTNLDEHDLLAISIGGNDARLYQQLGGPLSTAGLAAKATAATTSADLLRLVGSGSPTISFLAGDTGRLPEIAGDASAQAVRSAYSASFNSAMQQTLAGLAANGSIVHYLDLNLVLDDIIANPTAYGITNGLACPSFAVSTACVLNSSGYLFYGDGLHLTSDGFKIVARYIATQLEGPLTLQAPGDIEVDTAHQFGRTLQSRLGLVGIAGVKQAQGMSVFLTGDAFQSSHRMSRGNDPFDTSGFGVTGGINFGFDGGAAGLAVNYTRPKANFSNDAADVKSHSVQVGGYAGMGFGAGGYVKAHLGYGWDKNNIDRAGVVEGMSASPKGSHWIAGARAAYLVPMAGLQLGPVAALDYARAKVNGYTENGDPALTLNVSSQTYKSLRGGLGLEMTANLFDSQSIRPYLSAMAEKELSGNRSIQFSQTSAPIIVNSFDFETPSKKVYGRFNLGATTLLSGNLSLDANVSLTAGRKYGNETGGQLALKVGF
jgi:outer membrane lipase/esterase